MGENGERLCFVSIPKIKKKKKKVKQALAVHLFYKYSYSNRSLSFFSWGEIQFEVGIRFAFISVGNNYEINGAALLSSVDFNNFRIRNKCAK